jgi:hypothetical protein
MVGGYGAAALLGGPPTVVCGVARAPASAQMPPSAQAFAAPPAMPSAPQPLTSMGAMSASGHTRPPSPSSTQEAQGASLAGTAALDAYLAQLAALARDLAREASGRCDAAALRRIRQRLTEWLEDLRSVGGKADLVSAVDALVTRLSSALAAPATLAVEAAAVAAELAVLASGAPPVPPKKRSRLAFWK